MPRLTRERREVRPGVRCEVAAGAWEPCRGAERDFPDLDCDARERERDRGSPFGRDERDERPDRRDCEGCEPGADREAEDVQARSETRRQARRQVILAHHAEHRDRRGQDGERERGPHGSSPEGAEGRRDACEHPPAVAVGDDGSDLADVGQPARLGRVEHRAQHLVAARGAVVPWIRGERRAVDALGGGHDASAGCSRRATTSDAVRSRAASSATTRSPSPVMR